jgi:hypothetical protein
MSKVELSAPLKPGSAMVERTLYPVKLWFILRFVAIAALAFLVASTGGPYGGSRGPVPFFVLLLLVLFYAAQLLPGAVYLKLTPEGFEYKNVLPARFVKWSDVDHFTTYRWHRFITSRVGWVYSDLALVGSAKLFFAGGFFPRVVSRLLRLRIDDGFTVNFELKTAESLALLLEQWRRQHDDATWVKIDSTPKKPH